MTTKDIAFFKETAAGILTSPYVQQMKQYPQHGKTNTLCHMVAVAWKAYELAVAWETKKGKQLDKRSLIRGALLHDLFLYDWHDPNNGHKLHGFSHPYTALQNAEKRFTLNKIERNIIVRHMFPFTPIPPKYKESILVSYADKFCSAKETLYRDRHCGVCHVCPLHKSSLQEESSGGAC